MAAVNELPREERESRAAAEILSGNVPAFLRQFVPIHVRAEIGGDLRRATYWVSPDYLCVGSDADFVRGPLTPQAAQAIADKVGCLLPTRKMVDDIWQAAAIKLEPQPISPATTDITLAATFARHNQMIEQQRAGRPLGQLVAGIKKDVVITPKLAARPGKVAIYGWHYPSGKPIQPLYLGHIDSWVDYSHGIRLVYGRMVVDGEEMAVADVLADAKLNVLLSDEGVVARPRY